MQKEGLARKHSSKLEMLCKLIDAILIAVCFYVSALMNDFPWNPHFSFIAAVSVVLFHQFAKKNHLYLSWRTSSIWNENKNIIKSWVFVFLLLIALALLMDLTGGYVRRVLVSWFLTGITSLLLWRVSLRILLHHFRMKGKNKKFVAIAGAGVLGSKIVRSIINNPWTGLSINGIYDDFKPKGSILYPEIQVEGNLDDLVNVAKSGCLDYIYIALPIKAEKRIMRLVNELADTNVSINLIPDRLMLDFLEEKVISMDGVPIVNIMENPLHGQKINQIKRFSQLIKRVFDVTVALLAILIFSPIMMLFSCLILILEGRPITYRSKRYTSANQKVLIYKFRSMIRNATDPKYKLKERFMRDGFLDIPLSCEAYTPLGRIIEKTQIVELPQLFNIIFDEMSLIGNRPLPFDNLILLKKHKGWERRFDSPAGMTGITQVIGKLNLIPQERLELEGLYSEVYIKGNIIKCDILIAYYTIRLILFKKETSKEKAFEILKDCLS